MSQQLISLSPDLKRLRDEGYEIQIKGGYLLSHHIPYINNKKEIKFGVLVSELTLSSDTKTARPGTHVIGFIGDYPCNKDGSPITAIQHATQNEKLFEGIVINHKFSNKPPGGYDDYFLKISRYAEIISAPAKSVDQNVTEKTFKVLTDEDEATVFNYLDTNTSRANLHEINSRFKGQRIAIIGLGGTGTYILDLVSKTPVLQIYIYDRAYFLQHNSFRSPGTMSIQQLSAGQFKKVRYYAEMYSKMHKGIVPHEYYINDENVSELAYYSYVFICVDKNSARKLIMEHLVKTGVSFIDVGLGVNIVDKNLIGTIRVTSVTKSKNDHLPLRVSSEDNDINEYNTNIQIADLNSLNAALAVIKWKKLSGFYQDLKEEHHTTYSINVSQLINEDITT